MALLTGALPARGTNEAYIVVKRPLRAMTACAHRVTTHQSPLARACSSAALLAASASGWPRV